MITTSRLFIGDARNMKDVKPESVDLVVTSPPYPMIEMWDQLFFEQDEKIEKSIRKNQIDDAFERMHLILDQVWDACYRVLRKNGFACINIGDATRTLHGDFRLFPNHARILQHLARIGFCVLPAVLWRKQTNAPNKFMGSGMLPAGAYVTLEHEYILIVRKGGKREFLSPSLKALRQASAIFWEERNHFFSDVWMDLKGTRQELTGKEDRKRSAAFPFELAYRLINMYSVKGDTVLDPFWGTGTTTAAAISSARNSVGYELSETFQPAMGNIRENIVKIANDRMHERLENHIRFVRERLAENKPSKYVNVHYGFPVVTNQEKNILFNALKNVTAIDGVTLEASYEDTPQQEFVSDWTDELKQIPSAAPRKKTARRKKKTPGEDGQLSLF